MADLSDVEKALNTAIADILTSAGVAPQVSRVRRGWPDQQLLEKDLAAKKTQVTIFPQPNTTRNTTRWELKPVVTPGAPTLTATMNGPVVTFGGTASAGQVAGIRVGPPNAAQAATYRLQNGDTPATVAAALAKALGATSNGATVTIATNQPVIARVVADGTSRTEVQRQDQAIMVTVWAPTPNARDQVASAIFSGLAAIRWLQLADGSQGWIRYRATASFNQAENANAYRRDLTYTVEYGATVTEVLPSVVFPEINLVRQVGVNTIIA